MRAALKESHELERTHRDSEAVSINATLAAIRRKRHISYEDRLEGRISTEFWAERNADWKAEEARLEERLARLNRAETRYMEVGVQLLNQAETIDRLYARAEEPADRRDLLATLLDRCVVKEGVVTPTFRPAWAVIAGMAAEETPLPTLDQLRRGYRKIAQGSGAKAGPNGGRTGNPSSARPNSAGYKVHVWGG
jgi:hypothetical protein